MRKSTVALATVGIGAGMLYAFGQARVKKSRRSLIKDVGVDQLSEQDGSSEALKEHFEIDDRGTNQNEAVEILTKIKDDAFASSDEKLALALGRPVEEIQAWTKGEQTIDSDGLMKARALALERGVRLEELD